MMLDDQRYELREIRPYVREDGGSTRLLVWETVCPKCGDPLDVITGLTGNQINRRCSDCKRPGKPVTGKRGRKVNVTIIEA